MDPLKDKLREEIESRLKTANNMSANLMKQCIRQDKSVFDAKKLDAIDPRYSQELWNAIKPVASIIWHRNKHLRNEVQYPFNLRHSTAFEQQVAGEVVTTLDTTANIKLPVDFPVSRMTPEQIRRDIAQALGSVEVVLNKHSVTVIDYFDAPGSHTSTMALLTEAAMIRMRQGANEKMYTAIARVFCKEGPNGEPTDSSIPVKITLDITQFGGYAAEGTSEIEAVKHYLAPKDGRPRGGR